MSRFSCIHESFSFLVILGFDSSHPTVAINSHHPPPRRGAKFFFLAFANHRQRLLSRQGPRFSHPEGDIFDRIITIDPLPRSVALISIYTPRNRCRGPRRLLPLLTFFLLRSLPAPPLALGLVACFRCSGGRIRFPIKGEILRPPLLDRAPFVLGSLSTFLISFACTVVFFLDFSVIFALCAISIGNGEESWVDGFRCFCSFGFCVLFDIVSEL